MSVASVLKEVHKDLLPANLNKGAPETYRKIANVATLSKHPFEAPREGSPSSSGDSRPSSRATFALSRRTSFTSYSGDGDRATVSHLTSFTSYGGDDDHATFSRPHLTSITSYEGDDDRATFSPRSHLTSFAGHGGYGDLERDYVVVLNNFFQGHPTGNLAPYFQYVMTREGRDDAPIYIATARCEHHSAE